MRYSDPALLEHLASAYVLGTLRHGARRRFEGVRRERADVELMVAEWEDRLARLTQSIPPRHPSVRVWRAIEARTRPAQTVTAGGWSRWLKTAGFTLGGVAAGLVGSIALVITAPTLFLSTDQVAMRAGEKLPQSYVGLLTDAHGDGKLLVSSLRNGRVMTIKVLGPITPPAAGSKLLLWAVPAEAPPFLLGEVPTAGSAVSRLPDTSEKLLSKVRKLMVTLETSDSPAAPGPVVLSGNCAKLW